MYRVLPITIFLFLQLTIFSIGIAINPVNLVLIPIGLLILLVILINPSLSLLLLAIAGLVKGFINSLNPIFELIDYTLIITFLLWCGLLFFYLRGKLLLPRWSNGIINCYILFCIILFLSGFYTPSPNYGWLKIIRFIVFSTTMFITPFLIINNSKDSRKLLVYFNGVILSIAIGMFAYIVYLLMTGNIFTYLVRVTVLSSNPITIGAYMAMGVGIIINTMNWIRFKYSIFLIPILIILLLALLSTGSRGPTLGLFLGLIIYTIFFERNRIRKNRLITFGSVAIMISVLIIIILPDFLTTRFSDISSGDFVVHQGSIQRVSTIALRLGFWKTSIIEWSSSLKTLIIGIGSGGFSSLYILRDFRHFPHNFFIETLLETGIIGFTVLIFLFYSIWTYIYSRVEYTFHTSIWITATLVRFFTAQFSGDLVDNRGLFMLMAISVASFMADNKESLKYKKHTK